jgi:hypothetical protein
MTMMVARDAWSDDDDDDDDDDGGRGGGETARARRWSM